MSKVKEFFKAIAKDEDLRAKLEKSAKDSEGKEMAAEEHMAAFERNVLPIAKAAGFDFTMDDVKAYEEWLKSRSGELDDDEIENVAGGISLGWDGANSRRISWEEDDWLDEIRALTERLFKTDLSRWGISVDTVMNVIQEKGGIFWYRTGWVMDKAGSVEITENGIV